MNFEFEILDFLASLHTPLLDTVMVFVTHLGDKGFVWILLGFLMYFSKKHKRAGATVLLALLMMLVCGNIILKPLVARIRPFEIVQGIKLLIDAPRDFSFPSGHTFASFAASVSVLLYHKRVGTVLICLASLIAFSRLYLYVHFPTDVLAGIIFGIASAFISRAIISKQKFLSL